MKACYQPAGLDPDRISRLLREHAFSQPKGGAVEAVNPVPPLQVRAAAVLMLLTRQPDDWHLVFTRRTETVQDHKGQVSFPGGVQESSDPTLVETALRESHEEIGVAPQDVVVLGQLDPMLTRSAYLVMPVVGMIQWPYTFQPSPDEVTRVFTIPLGWLAGENRYSEKPYFRPALGFSENVLYFEEYDGELLWGISATLTVNLLDVLGLTTQGKPSAGK
jgi:8-oxo-dGTP pyrophosphatase MutT (NUDIX family)